MVHTECCLLRVLSEHIVEVILLIKVLESLVTLFSVETELVPLLLFLVSEDCEVIYPLSQILCLFPHFDSHLGHRQLSLFEYLLPLSIRHDLPLFVTLILEFALLLHQGVDMLETNVVDSKLHLTII